MYPPAQPKPDYSDLDAFMAGNGPNLDDLLAGAKSTLASANAFDAANPHPTWGSLAPKTTPVVDPTAPSLPRTIGAMGVRGLSGLLASFAADAPGVGTAVGAGLGSGGEALAEEIEGRDKLNPLQIAAQGGLGAVPMGPLMKLLGVGGSAVRAGLVGALHGGAAGALTDSAETGALPTPEAIGLGAVTGGAASGLGHMLLSGKLLNGERGPAPLKVERYAPNTSAVSHVADPEAAALPFSPSTAADATPRQMAGATGVDLPFDAAPAPAAKFAFHQDDFNGGSIPLYNVEGGPLDRSTVSAETLGQHGIAVPETPAFVPRQSAALAVDAAAPLETPVTDAPPADTRSPLQRLLSPRVSAAEAADNLARDGSLLGSPHTSNEVAGMEQEFGDPLPEVQAQLSRRRQAGHMEDTRNNARYDYLTAPDEVPPTSRPDDTPPSTPPSDGRFTLPEPSPAMRTRLNDLLDARDRSMGREPVAEASPAAALEAPDPHSPVMDASGRPIAPAQGALAERPAGPWSTNGTDSVEPAATGTDGPAGGLEAGFANTAALRSLLRVPVGAAAGAYFDPENQERGAVLGGGLGALSMAPGAMAGAERLRYASMLAGGAPIKKILSDTGVALNTAGERSMTHGPGAGLDVLKQFFSPTTVQDAVNRIRTGGMDANASVLDQPKSTSYKGLLGVPSRIMGGLTQATQGALERAGVDTADAAKRTFTAEPETKGGQKLLDLTRSSPLARLFLPFVKTATNIAEAGTLPIANLAKLGDMTGAGRTQALAKVGMLGASGAAGAAFGNSDFADDHPTLAKMAPLLTGPGMLPFASAQAFMHALKSGKTSPQALEALAGQVRQSLPLPSEWGTSPEEMLASLAPTGVRAINNTFIDPEAPNRDTSGSTFGALIKRIPGLSKTLPLKGDSTPRINKKFLDE